MIGLNPQEIASPLRLFRQVEQGLVAAETAFAAFLTQGAPQPMPRDDSNQIGSTPAETKPSPGRDTGGDSKPDTAGQGSAETPAPEHEPGFGNPVLTGSSAGSDMPLWPDEGPLPLDDGVLTTSVEEPAKPTADGFSTCSAPMPSLVSVQPQQQKISPQGNRNETTQAPATGLPDRLPLPGSTSTLLPNEAGYHPEARATRRWVNTSSPAMATEASRPTPPGASRQDPEQRRSMAKPRGPTEDTHVQPTPAPEKPAVGKLGKEDSTAISRSLNTGGVLLPRAADRAESEAAKPSEPKATPDQQTQVRTPPVLPDFPRANTQANEIPPVLQMAARVVKGSVLGADESPSSVHHRDAPANQSPASVGGDVAKPRAVVPERPLDTSRPSSPQQEFALSPKTDLARRKPETVPQDIGQAGFTRLSGTTLPFPGAVTERLVQADQRPVPEVPRRSTTEPREFDSIGADARPQKQFATLFDRQLAASDLGQSGRSSMEPFAAAQAQAPASAPVAAHANTAVLAMSPDFGRDLARIVAHTGDGSVTITLAPRELGTLTLHLSHDDGRLLVVIQAERPETLDLARRHIDPMLEELSRQGFGRVDVSFGTPGGQRDQRATPGRTPHPRSEHLPALSGVAAGDGNRPAPPVTSGMDILL